jgi:hypothetical protein
MRNVKAATNRLLKTASVLDQNELCGYADVLHNVLRRVAMDESMFNNYEDEFPGAPVGYEHEPTMEELERADLERELFEYIMKRENSPEGLTGEERERQLQIMHYLKGNSWDSYQGDPENEKLRAILDDNGPGYISEQIDDSSPYDDPGDHEYR